MTKEVYDANTGKRIEGITACTIHPLKSNEPVRATLEFALVEVDMVAEDDG